MNEKEIMELAELVKEWRNTPKTYHFDTERFILLVETMKELQELLDEELVDAVVQAYPCPLGTGNAIIEFGSENIVITDTLRFCQIAERFSNFEITAGKDGGLIFSAVFNVADVSY